MPLTPQAAHNNGGASGSLGQKDLGYVGPAQALCVWLTGTEKYNQLPRSQRLLIGVSGIPGSGKTTLAAEVVKRVNALYRAQDRKSVV